MTKSNETLSRRKALGRLGMFAAAAYTVPALTTLSMAHASGTSGASKASASGASASGASASGASASAASAPSTPSGAEAICGPANPGDTAYDQCLIDNGLV